MAKKLHLYLICLFCTLASSFVSGSTTEAFSSNIQRVRIDFTMPDGYVRHLLLAFTQDNMASDNYDYGYDAINRDAYPYDLSWMVGDLKCTTQGVGAFDDSKKYPLNMYMSQNGHVEIALDALENFDTPIDLFIYDSLLDTYTQINDSNYADDINEGDHFDRFYLAFKDNSTSSIFAKSSLSNEDISLSEAEIGYLNNTKELFVNTNNTHTINTIQIFNLSGQEVFSLNQVNANQIRVPVYMDQLKFGLVLIKTQQGALFRKKIALR